MLRYKQIFSNLIGINKSPSNKDKILALENDGMIDMIHHQFKRYSSITHFTKPHLVWVSWLRR
jgi:hypothetical protein